MLKSEKSANRYEHQNSKEHQNQKTNRKNSQNCKTKNPSNPHLHFSLERVGVDSISSCFGSPVVYLSPNWCGARETGSQNGWKSSLGLG